MCLNSLKVGNVVTLIKKCHVLENKPEFIVSVQEKRSPKLALNALIAWVTVCIYFIFPGVFAQSHTREEK